jgi:nucleoid DNA-binding protein
MTLTKRDLVTRISEETGLIQQQVLEVVQKTLDYIAEALARGDKVELRNFGVFEVKVRKARIGRNPNAPETDVPIPQRSVVKFKPGKQMRAEVFKIHPPTDGSAVPTTQQNYAAANSFARLALARDERSRVFFFPIRCPKPYGTFAWFPRFLS